MAIIWDKRTFHLFNEKISYVIKVTDANHLMHVYFGERVYEDDLDYALNSRNYDKYRRESADNENMNLQYLPQEFASFGSNDPRLPSIRLEFKDGSRTTDFKYHRHQIIKGKPKLEGLPATYGTEDEVETLVITLKDAYEDVFVELSYSIFKDYNVITRHTNIINNTKHKINIERITSATLDLSHVEGDMIQLSGTWAKERFYERTPLRQGIQEIASRKGSSSHDLNPLLIIASKDAHETYGEVLAMNFVYSGNFEGSIEVDAQKMARMSMGINDFDFKWALHPNDTFVSPEVVLVYANDGLEDMTHTFHNLYSNHLIKGKHKHAPRPILLNNWEATYFDFNETKILNLAQEASALGIELFVLDDGWFGKRNNDQTSLGDWFVNKDKLPSGLDNLSKKINDLGMKFGIWFEPEMISPTSELYKKHPEWIIGHHHRRNYQGRSQYILDITRKDVQTYILDSVSNILDSANIEYVKWDYNRFFTDIYSSHLKPEQQKELTHRYILSLYSILDKLTTKYKDVLFESCAGGGGRFDPGMLYYTPQIWTSDNTDAIERLKIQHGTSLAYPNAAMGCHVSSVPNHQVGRITPLKTRGIVAMSGNFGYELNLLELSKEEKEEIKNQIKTYKTIRNTVQYGTLFRLSNANDVSWMYVNKDKSQVVVNHIRQKGLVDPSIKTIKLKGLAKDAYY
ncbi:MAG TPA: alpha-galactosidase, partial [Erysipelothrix sp.]|nr:alpha-galactosidase [Erysipelothrix sp.]